MRTAQPGGGLGSLLLAGLAGRCPRCRVGKAFSGFLALAPVCDNCKLDLQQADVGDGPVPFVITIGGFAGAGLGSWVLLSFDAPVWLSFLTIPPVLVLSVAMIRPLKGLLMALQYHHRAADSGGGTFGAPEDADAETHHRQ